MLEAACYERLLSIESSASLNRHPLPSRGALCSRQINTDGWHGPTRIDVIERCLLSWAVKWTPARRRRLKCLPFGTNLLAVLPNTKLIGLSWPAVARQRSRTRIAPMLHFVFIEKSSSAVLKPVAVMLPPFSTRTEGTTGAPEVDRCLPTGNAGI